MIYGEELAIGELITYNFQLYRIVEKEGRVNELTDERQIWLDLVSLTGGEPIRAYVHPTSEWEYLKGHGYVPSSEVHLFQDTNDAWAPFAEFLARKAEYANTYEAWLAYATTELPD